MRRVMRVGPWVGALARQAPLSEGSRAGLCRSMTEALPGLAVGSDIYLGVGSVSENLHILCG